MNVLIAFLLVSWPVLAAAAEPVSTTPGLAEIASFTFWKDVIPLFSVPLAVVAFFHSRRSDLAKAEREQRDELKGLIEKLLDFRAQLEQAQAIATNEQQYTTLATRLNTRKSIYLQSAEELANGLPRITPAEWAVLGFEHQQESNFVHAEKLYQRGVDAADSESSSLILQVFARRSLAGAQMAQGDEGLGRGRASYQTCLDILQPRTDPYSLYTCIVTLRYWANDEFFWGHPTDTMTLMRRAGSLLAPIIGWSLAQTEARDCVRYLLYFANMFRLQKNDLSACAAALDLAEGFLGDWPDDPTIELRGNIALARAWLALAGKAGDEACAAHAKAAQTFYEALAAQNPARKPCLDAVEAFRRAPRI